MNDNAAPAVIVSITVVLPGTTPASVPVPARNAVSYPHVSTVTEEARERASRYAEEYVSSLHLIQEVKAWEPTLKAAYIQGYITREAGI